MQRGEKWRPKDPWTLTIAGTPEATPGGRKKASRLGLTCWLQELGRTFSWAVPGLPRVQGYRQGGEKAGPVHILTHNSLGRANRTLHSISEGGRVRQVLELSRSALGQGWEVRSLTRHGAAPERRDSRGF